MPLSVSSAVRQLSDGNTAGTVLGKSPTDLISFYGATPIVQPSGGQELTVSTANAGGFVATDATSQSPGGITPNSTNEVAMTLGATTVAATGTSFSLLSTDFLVANKPTQQAGIAVGNVRYGTSQAIDVAFSNFTAATVTATAGEKWGVVAIRGLPTVTETLTPAAVAAATTVEQLFTVPGIAVGGGPVGVSAPSTVTNVNIANVRVAAANQVGITFSNASTATATAPPAGTYTFWQTNGVGAGGNNIGIQANVGVTAGPVASNVSAQSFTVTGLATTDQVIGVSKPTAQAGLSLGSAFVSATNLLGVNFINITATVTPTTYEVYGVTIFRPQPAAPVVTYSQALTPAVVPPNSTSSQLFTVTGLIASSMVMVNKPSFQAGLGIGGYRATSNANQLEITYLNDTATTITPNAETYAIANFQQAIPDTGDTWIFPTSPQGAQAATLVDSMRSALVALGLIAGS
jgi:hypothetical protein